MAIASVQKATGGGAAGSTTVAATFGVAVTTGNCVVGAVSWQHGSATATVSDGTNTYTMRTKVQDGGVNQNLALFYFEGIVGTPTVVTATFSSSSTNRSIIVQEFSGIATSSAFDVGAQQNLNAPGTGTDAVTSGAATTTADGDLIYSACEETVFGSIVFVAGTNFTQQDSYTADTFDVATESRVQVTQGSAAGLWTDATRGASGNYNVAFISMKAAAAGGGPVSSLLPMLGNLQGNLNMRDNFQ